VAQELRALLTEYEVVDELEHIPPELRGQHMGNPVNLPPHGGVQLELPPRVRGLGPYWSDEGAPGLRAHTRLLVDGIVAAAARWPVAG
jgi:phage replication-related protein YjqB (UPF0714/DUF867 family)